MNAIEPLVFIVDDDDSVRRALARLIGAAGYRVAAFASARAFLDDAPIARGRACLVLDVELPGLDGLELQQALQATHAALPIVFISGHGDIPMTVAAMKAGATDFLAKPVTEAVLLKAVSAALERSARSLAINSEIESIRRRVERLTPREREVLILVASGWMNKQVASELGTVEKTVKVHRARVMEKMEAHSLAELVRLSDKAGLTAVVERRV